MPIELLEEPQAGKDSVRLSTMRGSANRLTVAHVITQLDLGGAQRHVLSVLSRLDRRRFRALLVTGTSGLLMDDAVAIPDLEWYQCASLHRAIHPTADFLAIRGLMSFFRRQQVDIVHTHSSKAGILGRLAGAFSRVPIIVHTVHGFGVTAAGPRAEGFFRVCERLAARRTHCLIAVSHGTRAEGLAMGIGRAEQYTTIPYRVELPECRRTRREMRRVLGLSDDDPVVGLVACLKPQKAPLDAVAVAERVVAQTPTARFVFVGDGELRPAVEAEILRRRLQGHVILLGWRRDVPDLLAAMDAVCLTSRWEGLPIALLEAMALRKPVVATNVGGMAELVEHGRTGYIAEHGDVASMSKYLQALLNDAHMADAFGAAAQEKFLRTFHGESAMVSEIERLYHELAGVVAH